MFSLAVAGGCLVVALVLAGLSVRDARRARRRQQLAQLHQPPRP